MTLAQVYTFKERFLLIEILVVIVLVFVRLYIFFLSLNMHKAGSYNGLEE